MKSITEIRDWLLENAVDVDGDLNIIGLDFSEFDGDVDIRVMKVKGNLFQSGHEVQGNLYQTNQKVKGNLFQSNQTVQGDLYQDGQEVRVIEEEIKEMTRQAIAKMWKLEYLDKQLSEDDKCSALYQEKIKYEQELDELIKKMEETK